METDDVYGTLGVSRTAGATEIRRAYRGLLTKHHPDRGGSAVKFASIQRAYEILADADKRRQFDATGTVTRSVDEEFAESFGGGAFRDRSRAASARAPASMADAIAVQDTTEASSHSAGFAAWQRSRGEGGAVVYTAETIADQLGVEESSYTPTPLPPLRVYTATVTALGRPGDVVSLTLESIPPELKWGEVLVAMRYAPITPADLYACLVGAVVVPTAPGADRGSASGLWEAHAAAPFVAGSDGVAVVQKVGPGVKTMAEGDWVLPFKPSMGTWRTVAVWKERDLLKMPAEMLPLEHAALLRELCCAYRLLEDHGRLQPGDAVILNAATSTVGSALIQLCKLLKLRAVAVCRDGPNFEVKNANLRALGAAEVLRDEGSFRLELAARRFGARPKLALDCVGGASAARLADSLESGSPLVVYGCMSGKPPALSWQQLVFGGLTVQGFNLRSWMAAKDNKKNIVAMMETLARLVNADRLRLDYTLYDLAKDFDEALEHALSDARATKVMFQVTDIGVAADDAAAK